MFFENNSDDTEVSRIKNENGKGPSRCSHLLKPHFQQVSTVGQWSTSCQVFAYAFTGANVNQSYGFTA